MAEKNQPRLILLREGGARHSSLTAPLVRVSQGDEIRYIYGFRTALESVRNGEQITLSDLNDTKQYLGGKLSDELYDFLSIPAQASRAIDGMQSEIELLKGIEKPDEMDPGVNFLEANLYPRCRRQVYLNLRAETFLELMKNQRNGQEDFIAAERARLQSLNEQFDEELGKALGRVDSGGTEDCKRRAMDCVELSELDHPY